MRSSKLVRNSRRIGLALAVSLLFAPTAKSQTATGSYTGDGVVGRAINIGFRPDIVIIKVDYEDTVDNDNSSGVIRTSTMTGDNTKPFFSFQAFAPNLIQSLDATGFTVGNDIMVNGALAACGGSNCPYYWVAFRADANTAVGGYTGNGTTQSLTGFGFSPEYVMVLPAGAIRARHRTTAGTTHSRRFSPNGAVIMDAITSLDADGFTVNKSADALDDPNTSGQTYHFVAWNAAPGRMAIGAYQGDDLDFRQFTSVGFSPLYVIVTPYDTGGDAFQRTADMTGDASVSFRKAITTNHIQSFLPNGFEIGSSSDVNRDPENFFYVAFGSDPAFVPLTSVAGGGGATITVTAPGSFEMRFNTATGGGIDEFFDLVEDSGRSTDLAGGDQRIRSLLGNGLFDGSVFFNADQNDNGAKLDLLEATPTRVRVRQESFYQEELGTNILPGVKAIGDYSVYGSGRVALRWNRRTTSAVTYVTEELSLAVHRGAGALANWTGFTEGSAGPFPVGPPGFQDFNLQQIEEVGARTDFLEIMYRDWRTTEGHFADADAVDEVMVGAPEWWGIMVWRESNGGIIPADTDDAWDFLTYFKPTDFVDQNDAAVTSRAADYRTPDPLSFALGSGWNENTADADFFNESEAAYTMDFAPGTGLTLDMDGSSTTRRSPVMKIRQWRSLADPVVTLEGVPLVNDVDYMADVKPVSRAYFAEDLLWHSTLENLAALDTAPDVGTPGATSGTVNFVAARYGNGAQVVGTSSYFNFPTSGNLDTAKGAIELWYRSDYDSTDGSSHTLGGYNFNGANFWLIEKDNSNNLRFRITALATTSEIVAGPASYSWRANEWVHLRIEWDDTLPVATQLKLFVNGVEPNPGGGTGADYVASTNVSANFQIGRRSPGGGSPGIYDEVLVYGGAGATPSPLAHGGLTASADEFLADTAKNFTFTFAEVNGDEQGEYLHLGADAKFRGINARLAVAGSGTPDTALKWEYWNGAGWAELTSGCCGFVDGTRSFQQDGTLYWTSDPPGWDLYSLRGGPDLYYVRAFLTPGVPYTTFPTEAVIKTDILLFQYGGDITAAAQTFDFAVPVPTAVELTAFDATAGDGEVLLEWETASELSNLGFHLYRASSPSGPFEAITRTPIPGLGSSPVGASYTYRDSGLSNGSTYFYLLEDIETTGRTERHGPVTATPVAGAAPLSESGTEATARITYGHPSENGLSVRKTRSGLVLELSTAGFYAFPEDDGTVRIEIPDFMSVAGAALPVRRQWVDAMARRQVNVVSVRARDIEHVSLRPSGDGAVELVATENGVVRTRRAARRARRRRERDASAWARVVSVGFQGELKKALMEMSPLRWDAATGELALAKRLVVRVSFNKGSKREPAAKGTRGRRRGGVVARLVTTERGLHGVRFEDVFPGGCPGEC